MTATQPIAAPSDPSNPAQVRLFMQRLNKLLTSAVSISPSGYIVIDGTVLNLAIKSPNGHYWKVEMDNSGNFVTTDLGTTPP